MKFSARLVPFATLCCAGINNPYFIISRARSVDSKDEFLKIFRGPTLNQNTTPVWNPFKIKLGQLCNGDRALPLKIEVFSHDEEHTDKLYGECLTTINTIIVDNKKEYNLMKGKIIAGNFKIDSFTIFERPSFMEYLRSGWAINLSLAIDFTASNGEVSEKDSLHWQDPSGQILNQYEQAILGVGKVMEPYALDGQLATFGFGGIPRYLGSNSPNHCFNLNGLPNPVI